MKKRNEFSSFDVAKALDISIERIRQWMNLGFITPTIPAKGQGTKAIFNRANVYQAALFLHLLDMGVNRSHSATIANEMINGNNNIVRSPSTPRSIELEEQERGEKTELLYVILNRKDMKPRGEMRLVLCSDLHAIKEVAAELTTGDFLPWSDITVINMKLIIEKINARLPE